MIRIRDRKIGTDSPCFIIAEAGVNHNGDLRLAKELVDVAAQVGADAVKFQTFKAERLVAARAPKAAYQVESTGGDESQLEMIKRLELTYDEFRELYDHCTQRNILFLSSPFDEESADFLEELGVAAFKIGSGEITNFPLLDHVARKNKPILLSTGMSYLEEVETAVRVIYDCGNRQLALFHCTSNYPTPAEDVNLKAMHTLVKTFDVPVGYSDHTEGIEISLAAVALGAHMIEKHFTLDKSLPGPDHRASIDPDEFARLVAGIRRVEKSLGDGNKIPTASETGTAAVARKSLVAAKDIPAGTILTEDLIAIKRPGTGLPPTMKAAIIGRRTGLDLKVDELFRLEDLS